MNKREFKRYIKSMQKSDPKPKAYGVYLWRGDGLYQKDQPIYTNASQKRAQTKADNLNNLYPTEPDISLSDYHGYVVRPIW